MNTTFGERLTELVEESRKTMSDIARDLNVSKQSISAWCRGERTPKYLTIVSIANYFQTTVSWLYGLNSQKHPANYQEQNKFGTSRGFKAFYSKQTREYQYLELTFENDRPVLKIDNESGEFIEMYLRLTREDRLEVLREMMLKEKSAMDEEAERR